MNLTLGLGVLGDRFNKEEAEVQLVKPLFLALKREMVRCMLKL